jgi:hypothetical protein
MKFLHKGTCYACFCFQSLCSGWFHLLYCSMSGEFSIVFALHLCASFTTTETFKLTWTFPSNITFYFPARQNFSQSVTLLFTTASRLALSSPTLTQSHLLNFPIYIQFWPRHVLDFILIWFLVESNQDRLYRWYLFAEEDADTTHTFVNSSPHYKLLLIIYIYISEPL